MTISRHFLKLFAVDGGAGTALAPISGTLTIDERQSPYCTASFVIALPVQETIDSLLGPRGGEISGMARVEYSEPVYVSDVTALAGGAPVSVSDISAILTNRPLSAITNLLHTPWNSTPPEVSEIPFQLRIDSAVPDYEAGTMQIEASSYETRLQEYRYLNSSGFLLAPNQSLRWIVRAVLGAVAEYFTLDLAGPDSIVESALVWEFGVSAWDFLDPLLQTHGFTLQCTEAGVWRMIYANDTPTVTVQQNRLTSLDPRRNRDDWADTVLVRWKWRAAGIDNVATDYATTPGSTVHKMLVVEHTTRYPGPGAAEKILARSSVQGADLGLSAVSRYDIAPGQQITVAPPGLPAGEGRITAVAFEWPSNLMQVTTQESAA